MSPKPLTDDVLRERVGAWYAHGLRGGARVLGIAKSTLEDSLKEARERNLMGYAPVVPGYRLSRITTDAQGNARGFEQKPEHGERFEVPAGHTVKGVSAYLDAEGQIVGQWIKTKEGADSLESLRAVANELNKTLKRAKPVPPPRHCNDQLANCYVISDAHLGELIWGEETRGENYDLQVAEQLLLDWFGAAIALSPRAHTGVFAQLGDFLHYDSLEAVTPTNKHILDTDSRLQKIIRVVIRVTRQIIAMLLQRHEHVHVIMASANHDPASSAWLRELLAAFYENEPRITVDNSPDIYYAYEWGDNALFYHHGHKRKVTDVDSVFAGKFKEMFGRAKRSYGHIGHLHSMAVVESNLMVIERHRTLAPRDAYANAGGWLSQQDAKVISYHKEYGEVGRLTISPMMVRGQ